MHDESDNYLMALAAFGVGTLVGGALALLLAPKSGAEMRDLVRDYAGRAKDEMYEGGRIAKAALDAAVERGKEAYASGKDTTRTAKETAVGYGAKRN